MKRCPQCNSVFADDNKYCLNDGTVLTEETLVMPSEAGIGEEPTVIRTEPIIVDIAPEIPPVQETIIVRRPAEEKTSKTPKYIVFMLLGLLIGGGLVLAAFLAAGRFYQNQDSNVDVALTNVNSTVKGKPKKTETPKKDLSENTDVSSDDSGEFNGRVIAVNANLRSEPGLYADEIEVLPINERINIIRRENDGSPWYFVQSESGASGWIHGNTIEWFSEADAF